MQRRILIGLLASFVGLPVTAQSADELVRMALDGSPALAALREGVAAAREMERPATALPDPMVEGMLQNEEFPDYTVGRMPMSMIGVEIRQPLPYPGKRRARGEAAEAETALRAARIAALESRITSEVRVLYGQIYAIDRERQALTAAHELVDLLSATAASRYASGGTEQEAVIKAQLQVSRLGEQIEDLEGERAARAAELGRWLGRPIDLPEITELPKVSFEALTEPASADIEVARAAVALAERRLAVARLDLKPDFSPSAGLAGRGPLGAVLTLRFGVELPFWKESKQEPLIRAAERELEMARQELRDAEAVAASDAARLAARWQQAERQVTRFREAIVPQSSTALDAARSSYLAARGDFSTVIEDFSLWLEARTQLARREADLYTTWAELQRLRSQP
ncbi:MAG TPA: TolC family protein [Thermoanaerobaculia bacterium]|jgi:outer membrane protein TolC|nr:TolC family protein [Thermoanaerobaculia bacterium]